MTTDGLPRTENTPPTPTPESGAPSGKVTCEFCQCVLGPSGEYMQLSPRAKELRAIDDTLSTVREELAASQRDLAEALRERDEANAEVRRLSTPPGEDGTNARGQKLGITW
jgi:hypothetical protein